LFDIYDPNYFSNCDGPRAWSELTVGEASMKKRRHVFQVIIEQDEAGYFVAECPALKACYTQGKTYEEVVENIKDVIGLCLEEFREKGKRIPRQPEIIGVKRIEVAA
jgi:predicted RNase H-like HicB family nuclease